MYYRDVRKRAHSMQSSRVVTEVRGIELEDKALNNLISGCTKTQIGAGNTGTLVCNSVLTTVKEDPITAKWTEASGDTGSIKFDVYGWVGDPSLADTMLIDNPDANFDH